MAKTITIAVLQENIDSEIQTAERFASQVQNLVEVAIEILPNTEFKTVQVLPELLEKLQSHDERYPNAQPDTIAALLGRSNELDNAKRMYHGLERYKALFEAIEIKNNEVSVTAKYKRSVKDKWTKTLEEGTPRYEAYMASKELLEAIQVFAEKSKAASLPIRIEPMSIMAGTGRALMTKNASDPNSLFLNTNLF